MFYQNVRLRASVSALYPWKISFKQFFRKKAVRNTPICWRCFWIPKTEDFLPLSAPAKRFRFERHIKTLSQRIMTTYRLLIAIEHALPNWPLEDYRKKSVIYGTARKRRLDRASPIQRIYEIPARLIDGLSGPVRTSSENFQGN